MGPSWGASSAVLGLPLGLLGPCWGDLRGLLGRLGRCEDQKSECAEQVRLPQGIGRYLPLGALLGVPLGGLLGCLEAILGHPEAILARLGLPWNLSGGSEGPGKLRVGSEVDPGGGGPCSRRTAIENPNCGTKGLLLLPRRTSGTSRFPNGGPWNGPETGAPPEPKAFRIPTRWL